MLGVVAIVLLTLAAALAAAFAQYLFKRSLKAFRLNLKGIILLASNRGVILGGLISLASLAVYLLALGSGQLTFVYPTFASTFVFVLLISHFALKEKVTRARALGIILIIAGIAIVALTYG